jgi:hypothetical protein
MNYADLWPAIQADIIGVIQADDFLGTRQGVLVEPGDIASVVAQKMAKIAGQGRDGKNGVGFLVCPIERADDDNPSMPGGPLKLTITIDWVENVIINQSPSGTGTPIRVFAAITEKVLKLYTPVGLTQNLVPAKPVISEFTDDTNKGMRIGRVQFTAIEADFRPFIRVNRPQLSVAGASPGPASPNSYLFIGPASVTVTAPDADTIFYTTDGSHPAQGNAAATPYTGPVAITSPGLFRARAFARGKAGSDTAAVNFFQVP